jgi:hypothetical protein
MAENKKPNVKQAGAKKPEVKPGQGKPMSPEEFQKKKRINIIFNGDDVKKLVAAKGFKLTPEMVDRNIEDFVRDLLGLEKRSRKASASKKAELCKKLGLDPEKATNSEIQAKMLEALSKGEEEKKAE